MEIETLCQRLDKLKYTEEGIKEERKTHPTGAAQSFGYNQGIEDAQHLIRGGDNPWIESPENPNNK